MPKPRVFKAGDLVNWRKRQLLKRALGDAGAFETMLDLPCGDGRFWPVYKDQGVASLVAAEVSKGMLDVASENRLALDFPARLMLTSPFDIDMEDGSVEFAACIDFYQHLARAEDQKKLLSELERVTRRSLVLSAYTGSNLEAQLTHSGFGIERFYDFCPGISPWRLYLLRKQN